MPEFLDPLFILCGFGVGFLVGLTGVGGGSLMTPALIFLFAVHPSTAVGTDLLYASGTKLAGTAIHNLHRNVDWPLVRRLFSTGKPHARWPIDWDAPDVRQAIACIAPERDLDDPGDRRALQALKLPGPLLDELLQLGAASRAAAPRHTGTSLVLHPHHASPAERARALGLVRALGGPTHYLELDGGHDMITPGCPGHDALLTALTRFAWDAWEPHSGRRLSHLDWP